MPGNAEACMGMSVYIGFHGLSWWGWLARSLPQGRDSTRIWTRIAGFRVQSINHYITWAGAPPTYRELFQSNIIEKWKSSQTKEWAWGRDVQETYVYMCISLTKSLWAYWSLNSRTKKDSSKGVGKNTYKTFVSKIIGQCVKERIWTKKMNYAYMWPHH